MTELLTAAQMRAIEQAAIESGEVTGLELMERAGRGVVEAVFEEWPDLAQAPYRAVVLCGPGNNGGDGFVIARLLKDWGWEVDVFLYGDPGKLPPDARVNYQRWSALGPVNAYTPDLQPSADDRVALIVDALFGTGLTRPIEAMGLTLLDLQEARAVGVADARQNRVGAAARVVAVDIPSGICSDSGRAVQSEGFKGLPDVAAASHADADLTVSFHRRKLGHLLVEGARASGHVMVKDIGLSGAQDTADLVHLVEPPFALGKQPASHKYTHGHALILSGGPGKGGAGRLAARGALRIGAGLVTVGCPPAALQENAAQLNAIMLKSLGSDEDLSLLLDSDTRVNALCLGPSMGTGARERQLVAAALGMTEVSGPKAAPGLTRGLDPQGAALQAGGPGSGPGRRGVVLDADALTLIAGDAALFAALHENCVLTPHAGEFARLFPDIAGKLDAPATEGPAYSKVDAAREAAKRAGCTVLFKGPDTVIASPDGRCAINSAHYDRAAPWLATAGSGDVLAGFIAGLLARGFAPQEAAETAAWLHVECALKFGPGLVAEDLPEMLPRVFRDLGL